MKSYAAAHLRRQFGNPNSKRNNCANLFNIEKYYAAAQFLKSILRKNEEYARYSGVSSLNLIKSSFTRSIIYLQKQLR